MKHFTIDTENSITVHTSRKAARETGADVFTTEEQFADLIGPDNKRLAEIWNTIPGVTAVTRFANRKGATERIWKKLQSLGESEPISDEAPTPAIEEMAPVGEPVEAAPVPESETIETTQQEPAISGSTDPDVNALVAPQSPDVGPEGVPATTKASRAKKARVAAPPREAGAPREGSKASQVIAMLKREGGTTLEEIMSAMGWLKHTTRAMLSAGGSLSKNHGLVVTSEKVGDKRIYSIKA